MKHLTKSLALLLALCFLCALVSCEKKEIVDSDPVDPSDLARKTTLTLLVGEAALPNASVSVCLNDSYAMPVVGAEITLSANGLESVTATTDEMGEAVFPLSCSSGTYKATFRYEGSAVLRDCTLKTDLVVRGFESKSGVYFRGKDLEAIDLAALSENGVTNLFLHQEVLSLTSHEGIEEFIAAAKESGISVHLWLICLWDAGGFVNPIDAENKTYNQSYFDTEAEKVRRAASLEGLCGLHFDYIRFEGDTVRADLYNATAGGTGETAVTEFVRQMTEAAETVNGSLVFSGAIMAEYADLIPRYGQDVDALSEYLDFFVPMLYVGNYEEDVAWLTECVRMLRQEFPEADLRPALLTYESDRNTVNKSEEALREEVTAAYAAGADGVVLFYYQKDATTLTDLKA